MIKDSKQSICGAAIGGTLGFIAGIGLSKSVTSTTISTIIGGIAGMYIGDKAKGFKVPDYFNSKLNSKLGSSTKPSANGFGFSR